MLTSVLYLSPYNTLAFYKWIDKDGVVHYSDVPPVLKKEIQISNIKTRTSKVNKKSLFSEYTDDFNKDTLRNGWLKKNISIANSFDLTSYNGLLIFKGIDKSDIEKAFDMPVIYKKFENNKDYNMKLHLKFKKVSGELKKRYSGLIFWDDKNKNEWFFLATRSNKIKVGKYKDGQYKSTFTKRFKYTFKEIVLLVKKKGNIYKLYFSIDGDDWKPAGDNTKNMPQVFNVGLFSETDSKGNSPVMIDRFYVKDK